MDIEQNKQKSKHQHIKSTKNYKTKAPDYEFKKPKTTSQLIQETKDARQNRKNQQRRNKLNDYLLKKRGIIDSDGNSSIEVSRNKSLSMSNLTQLIDLTTYKLPPKISVLIALNEDANLDSMMTSLDSTISESISPVESNSKMKYATAPNMITYTIPTKLYKGKERVMFIKTRRDVYNILDACKVADIIIFVTSCKKAEYNKWQLDPDKYSYCIDDFGYQMLSMIRAQGLTEHFCCVQDLGAIPLKNRNEIKKLYQRYFESEMKPKKTYGYYNDTEKDRVLEQSDGDATKSIISFICALAPYTTNLTLRKHRSYMLCDELRRSNEGLYAEAYGYIRGNTMNVNKYIHITGFGDYKVCSVEPVEDPLAIRSAHPINKDKMDIENLNPLESKTKKEIVEDDIIESKVLSGTTNQPQVIGAEIKTESSKPKGQVKAGDVDDDDIDIDFDINIDNQGDDDDVSFTSNPSQDQEVEEEMKRISNKHKMKTGLKYRTLEEMEFQDEVDTPIDIPAKERFHKYRGLESVKSGIWNPLENLPKEYGCIFSFDNISHTYNHTIRTTHDEGMKLSGNYVRITLMNFNFDDIRYIQRDTPLVLSTLLDHERKLCVMHYKIKTTYEQDSNIIQNLNKSVIEMQSGFRRSLTKPIFSSEVSKEKAKFHKFLEKDIYYYCTTYSQLTYKNTPVLMFIRKNGDGHLSLIGSGITVDADAKKVILKKVVLTGYPVKIKKKNAVVRYMFFNPTDVTYFRPIQLTTKNGLRGNIKESVGTHGYMKCAFNDFIKSNDTICLNLYKRVFPVWFKESWRYKIFYGNRDDYLSYFKTKENEEGQQEGNNDMIEG